MKKFKFSLEKLLDYKEQILQKEKNDLARLRQQRQEAVEERLRTVDRTKEFNGRFVADSSQGMKLSDITLAKSYINSLLEYTRQLEKMISIYDRQIEEQLQVVIEATREVSAIQHLKEKQLEEYRYQVQKADELMIEEFVSYQRAVQE